ncbi:hypothetical protein ABT237_19095 [Streptomyces sp. NPDC001581]
MSTPPKAGKVLGAFFAAATAAAAGPCPAAPARARGLPVDCLGLRPA